MNWRRVGALLAVLAILAPVVVASGTRPAEAGPEELGRWSDLGAWPFVPIHATLDDEGRVFTFGSTPDGDEGGLITYDVWDPSAGILAGHTTLPNQTRVDAFCSMTVTDPLAERVLLIGGNPDYNAGKANNLALEYNSADSSISRLDQEMHFGRWYPSATTLADGRILVQGGSAHVDGGEWIPVTTPEVYESGKGFSALPGARDDALYGDGTQYGRWWFPRTWVTPAGKLFGITGSAMYYIDVESGGSIERLGEFPTDNTRSTSTAVMFDVGRILQVGGGEGDADSRYFKASNKATIIDVTVDPPRLTQTEPMHHARHWANATVLPDGRVLVMGGSVVNNELEGVALAPEIWDPQTGRWTLLAANETPRLYHSTALLLPDGTVFNGGGGAPGPLRNDNAEVFSPPYLFTDTGDDARRPVIERAPSSINWGATFEATVGGDVERVTLIKTGAVTHSVNGEQRFMELDFTRDGDTLSIGGPANAAVATPGTYLLYVLDADGVPSVGSMMSVGGAQGSTPSPPPHSPEQVDEQRPSVVSNLEVRSGPAMIGVQWDPSTDDRGVVDYLISRSTNGTAGVEVARVSGASRRFTDRDIVDGVTYTYGVRAVDAGGNVSWHSELVSTKATAPTSLSDLLNQLERPGLAARPQRLG